MYSSPVLPSFTQCYNPRLSVRAEFWKFARIQCSHLSVVKRFSLIAWSTLGAFVGKIEWLPPVRAFISRLIPDYFFLASIFNYKICLRGTIIITCVLLPAFQGFWTPSFDSDMFCVAIQAVLPLPAQDLSNDSRLLLFLDAVLQFVYWTHHCAGWSFFITY